MQIKNIFTAVNSATRVTRVNNLKFQIRGHSSITSACFGGSLNRGLNKLHNLNSFYSILPKLGQAIYRWPNRHYIFLSLHRNRANRQAMTTTMTITTTMTMTTTTTMTTKIKNGCDGGGGEFQQKKSSN